MNQNLEIDYAFKLIYGMNKNSINKLKRLLALNDIKLDNYKLCIDTNSHRVYGLDDEKCKRWTDVYHNNFSLIRQCPNSDDLEHLFMNYYKSKLMDVVANSHCYLFEIDNELHNNYLNNFIDPKLLYYTLIGGKVHHFITELPVYKMSAHEYDFGSKSLIITAECEKYLYIFDEHLMREFKIVKTTDPELLLDAYIDNYFNAEWIRSNATLVRTADVLYI
jgi:hypothetical protein